MRKTLSSGGGGGTTYTAGAGVAINSGTISNTGLLAIGSATGSLSLGFGLTIVNGALQTTVTLPISGNGTPPAL